MKKISGLTLRDLEKYRDACDLAEIIGTETFERVVDLFSGQNIYIPTKRQVYIQARNREIIKEYEQGISIRNIALKYEVSSTWVSKLIKDNESFKAQKDGV